MSSDLEPLLPEVHLYWHFRRCLEALRDLLEALPALPERAKRPLHRPRADKDPHGLEFLAQHIRIPDPALEAALDPEVVGIQDP